MERRRLTARKALIGEIVKGRFIPKSGLESSYVLTKLGRRLSRVRIMGNIVDMYSNPASSFASLTIDDSTGVIRAKVFDNVESVSDISYGDLVDVIGKVKFTEGEIWINVEIINKVKDPNFETLRIVEIAKILKEQKEKIQKVKECLSQTSDINELFALLGEEISKREIEGIVEAENVFKEEEQSLKSSVLELIKELDFGDGADYRELLDKSGIPEKELDSIIQELLDTGACYEPRPGKIKRVI